MFGRIAMVSIFTLFLTGQVFAAPVPMPLKVMMRGLEIERRAPDAVPDIEVLSIRQVPAFDVLGRDDVEDLTARAEVAVEVAATALDGIVKAYRREAVEDLSARQISPEVATTALNGIITAYRREDIEEVASRQISPEVATTALNGIITEYRREDDEGLLARQQSQNQIPPEVATKTDEQGNVVLY